MVEILEAIVRGIREKYPSADCADYCGDTVFIRCSRCGGRCVSYEIWVGVGNYRLYRVERRAGQCVIPKGLDLTDPNVDPIVEGVKWFQRNESHRSE
ncbi:MAG: hypothetical protein Q8K86_06995 [Candidatus Nanopelagicaceae bacterium]|nr:hypothetical protein [Candidatus Nanopelagicaceae bacterium]